MPDRERLEELRSRARLQELRARQNQPQSRADVEADIRSRYGDERADEIMRLHAQRQPIDLDKEWRDNASLTDRVLMAPGVSEGIAATAGVGQGVTFGFNDEVTGLLAGAGSMLPGGRSPAEGYRSGRDAARDANTKMRDAHPIAFTGGELGGGLVGGGGIVRQAPRLNGYLGTAALGGAYGVGAADGDLQDRAEGGAAGAALGVGAKFGLERLGDAISPLLRRRPQVSDAVPELDELKAVKDDLYRQVDQQGATYSGEQVAGLFQGIADEIPTEGLGRITGGTHPATAASMRQMSGQANNPATLSELDRLRQLAGSASVTNPADQRLAGTIRQNIDEFTASTAPEGGGASAPGLLREARRANQTYRNAELVDDLITRGVRRADSTGSGGNTQNAVRQNIRRILDNPSLRRSFSEEEIAQMERVVRGTPGQNLTRQIGKLSPEGNGLMAMLGIGGAAINPITLLASGGGFIAKRQSDAMADRAIEDLVRLVRTGQPVAPQPTRASQVVTDDELQSALARLVAVGGTN